MIDQTWADQGQQYMSTWMGRKIRKVTLQANKECWATEKPFSSGRSTSIGCPVPNSQPQIYIHTSNTIWTKQIIFRNTYAYTYAYMIITIKRP